MRGLTSYLFHLIEFADMVTDGNVIPRTVRGHPDFEIPLKQKTAFAKILLDNFKKRRQIITTKDSISN